MISMPESEKDFVCSTDYADVHRISYGDKEALIFSFHPHIARCADFQKGLQQSMDIHQRFNHPNKMEVYTWNRAFIITENVQLWEMGSLGPFERLSHKKQLFSLLLTAHLRGIHHGSLHPEFIFVREDNSLAVMGWGFSQQSLPMIHLYRPPERYFTSGNQACDEYAMALFTYEFISRNKPWESRCTPYEIQMRKEKPLFRPLTAFGFSQAKSSIFMKALSNTPSQRFQSLEEFVNECPEEQEVVQEPNKVPTVGRFYKETKGARRGRNPQNTILFCVIALLAIFVGSYEHSARAGGTSWKHGFGMHDGSELMNGDGLGIKMIQIPRGNSLQTSFSMSETEITREQWSLVMSTQASKSSVPKTDITWLDAIRFCNTLSLINNKEAVYTIYEDHVDLDPTKNGYRLPTSQEWEYASKGNKDGLYSGSDNLDAIAWTSRNTKGTVQKVKTKEPNTFGLHDMTGNAAEWVVSERDCINNTCSMTVEGSTKGGSVRSLQTDLQSKVTASMNKHGKRKDIGFRIVIPNFE